MFHLMTDFGAKFAQLGVVHIDETLIFWSYVSSICLISTSWIDVVRNATFNVRDLLIAGGWLLL